MVLKGLVDAISNLLGYDGGWLPVDDAPGEQGGVAALLARHPDTVEAVAARVVRQA
ncbi:hypothetical protein ACLQ24_23075 [Micromonospora sp. DT4]|uniref:hypothetical protein n=1 Tax=Micromonospora sp. DT4 TaxID=3393438 RepID=UPI003CFB1879